MKILHKLFVLMVLFTPLIAYAGDRHEEPEGGFSYEVPDNWWVEEFSDLKFKIIITKPANGFSSNMTAIDEYFPGSLQEYGLASIPPMEAGIPGFKILSQGQGMTREGTEFRYIRYMHKADFGTLKQTAYFFDLGNNRKLVMTCSPAIGFEDKYDADCRDVIHSLKIGR